MLDDGFQHRQAARDLDLVLIDATRPFGFGHLLPRGLLREPLSALRRADAVIVTRADQVSPTELDGINRQVTEHHGQPPIAHAAHTWSSLQTLDSPRPVEELAGHDVFGVAGIGNPAAFRRQLESASRRLAGFQAFGDHHPYTADDVNQVFRAAEQARATAVVTTEKDWVKWSEFAPPAGSSKPSLPVYRPVVAMSFPLGEDALVDRLRHALPLPAPAAR
ncbi:MAG: tetraacyldisaccharide 4'-kinase [Planctomycetota bacterium]